MAKQSNLAHLALLGSNYAKIAKINKAAKLAHLNVPSRSTI